MDEILRRLLHVQVMEQDFDQSGKLPLLLTGLYDIRKCLIGEKTVYLIHPKEHVSLPNLKKHFVKLKKILEGDCVLYGDEYTRYGISKLTEMGIPFIFGDNNIYLPNLGIQIHGKPTAKLPDVSAFSPFTQKMVLTALYQNWTCISGKEIAEKLAVTRMTVNRAFLELEALELPLVTLEGKTKYFKNEFSREELYKRCEDFFLNPVKKTVKLRNIPPNTFVKSGVSALAFYTMLADDRCPSFAVTQEQLRNLELKSADMTSKDENPACILQVHRYLIDKDGVVDPISAILSVPQDDADDARVEQAIEIIKEDVFNGRWT